LGVKEKVTLAVNDYGSRLGFHWAKMNASALNGIAFMEAIVAPISGWDDFPKYVQELFQGFHSPAGEQMILEDNFLLILFCPKLFCGHCLIRKWPNTLVFF
jgi:haloalkane dehalogenase